MGNTARGITYPDPSGVPSRAALQTMAETADTAIGTAADGLMKVGRINVTTSSSGVATINHTLGRVPVWADASLTTETYRVAVTAESSSTITVKVVNASTGAAYVGTITVRWMVA